ncbi:hypothetical protein ILYODFUR_038254, partial [Ilyodon furcidens]
MDGLPPLPHHASEEPMDGLPPCPRHAPEEPAGGLPPRPGPEHLLSFLWGVLLELWTDALTCTMTDFTPDLLLDSGPDTLQPDSGPDSVTESTLNYAPDYTTDYGQADCAPSLTDFLPDTADLQHDLLTMFLASLTVNLALCPTMWHLNHSLTMRLLTFLIPRLTFCQTPRLTTLCLGSSWMPGSSLLGSRHVVDCLTPHFVGLPGISAAGLQ